MSKIVCLHDTPGCIATFDWLSSCSDEAVVAFSMMMSSMLRMSMKLSSNDRVILSERVTFSFSSNETIDFEHLLGSFNR